MCEPFTIAAMGATAIGTGIEVYAQGQEGDYQRKAAEENAVWLRRAGADAEQRGAKDVGALRMRGSAAIAEQRAAYGASGVDATVGTPASNLVATRLMAELDAATAKNNAMREAWGYRTEARQMDEQAEFIGRRAQQRQWSTILGGAGQLIGMGGKAYAAGGGGK